MRSEHQHRCIHFPLMPAVGAGHGVELVLAGAFQQVGPLAGVENQPNLGREGLAAISAGQVNSLSV